MITLYHGTTMEIASPFVKVGRKKVDFGQGFYLTKLRQQIAILSQQVVDACLKFKGATQVKLKGERHAR